MGRGQRQANAEFAEPVRVAVSVRRRIEDAFELFTAGINSWWPLATHSFGQELARDVVLELGVGGRFYERYIDGQEHTTGRVLEWRPPQVVVFTWQHDDWPGPTEVRVRFIATDSNETRVELEHHGWERLGAAGAESRESYANGWPGVMGCFAEAADAAS